MALGHTPMAHLHKHTTKTGKVKAWPGFEIETPAEKKKIYGQALALKTFDRMATLWARQPGQSIETLPAEDFNAKGQWPRQVKNVCLIYTHEGQPTPYGHMILWEYRYATRKHATIKRIGHRVT